VSGLEAVGGNLAVRIWIGKRTSVDFEVESAGVGCATHGDREAVGRGRDISTGKAGELCRYTSTSMAPTAVRFVEHAIVFGHNASEWSKHE